MRERRSLRSATGNDPMLQFTRYLLFTTACVLLCGAADRYVMADAYCELRVRYTGTLGDDPVWQSLPGDRWCNPIACPVSGDCEMKATNVSETLIDYSCECPSGGGSSGCTGVHKVVLDFEGNPTSSTLRCSGSCAANEVCDWKAAAAPGGQLGSWARCSCQVVGGG